MFDTIMAPFRSLFHEEVEEKNEKTGETETYLVMKGKGVRAWVGESAEAAIGARACGVPRFCLFFTHLFRSLLNG